ncbi:MAG: hypothetical protein COB36_15005 [Alphaproteobacteria bacterium]|nr:MAG: hypothetical protein COB36_15005 [Alphaproteobacteria bacterium]
MSEINWVLVGLILTLGYLAFLIFMTVKGGKPYLGWQADKVDPENHRLFFGITVFMYGALAVALLYRLSVS